MWREGEWRERGRRENNWERKSDRERERPRKKLRVDFWRENHMTMGNQTPHVNRLIRVILPNIYSQWQFRLVTFFHPHCFPLTLSLSPSQSDSLSPSLLSLLLTNILCPPPTHTISHIQLDHQQRRTITKYALFIEIWIHKRGEMEGSLAQWSERERERGAREKE